MSETTDTSAMSGAPPKPGRDAAIQEFADRFLAGPNRDLYAEMLLTVCRMAKDDAGRGEVKIVHKALQELRYAFKVFAPYRDVRKISIFGSSRTAEGHPDYLAAMTFARLIGERGWMIITGAGDGIMKAGHGGAGAAASFGVAIRLPFEQRTNSIIADDSKLVNFRYFFTRKLMFMKEASAVALFPGGFGTQDEGFEALVLIQTGKMPIVPIVMCERPGGTYWQRWREYVEAELLRTGMISAPDTSLFFITDDPAAAVEEVTRFYRVYHSSRWVEDDLMLRLNAPLDESVVARLNGEFADILAAGRITLGPADPVENGEFGDKPRLRVPFDKRSYGRLRRMIDQINATGA